MNIAHQISQYSEICPALIEFPKLFLGDMKDMFSPFVISAWVFAFFSWQNY